ncbi:GD20332 [Drosophila simulans]|uniref:GD20332 n=1 Tax=Drosophila simulans TaxID=7240 RepID=B4QXV8_DROSI|nr:GD20332 [Drosophila simulans]
MNPTISPPPATAIPTIMTAPSTKHRAPITDRQDREVLQVLCRLPSPALKSGGRPWDVEPENPGSILLFLRMGVCATLRLTQMNMNAGQGVGDGDGDGSW